MPKPGRPKPDGWEHAEVALMEGAMEGDTEALRALRARHPTLPWREEGLEKAMNPELALDLGDGVAAKFHARPLLDVVRREIELGVATKGSAFTTTADDDDKAEALSDDATGPEPRSRPNPPDAAAAEDDDDAFADPSVLFGLETREPFASAMIRGEKTIETRRYDLPRALLGRPIVLLATPASDAPRSELRDVVPAGAATVLGVVTFERAPPGRRARSGEEGKRRHRRVSPSSPTRDVAVVRGVGRRRGEARGRAGPARRARLAPGGRGASLGRVPPRVARGRRRADAAEALAADDEGDAESVPTRSHRRGPSSGVARGRSRRRRGGKRGGGGRGGGGRAGGDG